MGIREIEKVVTKLNCVDLSIIEYYAKIEQSNGNNELYLAVADLCENISTILDFSVLVMMRLQESESNRFHGGL